MTSIRWSLMATRSGRPASTAVSPTQPKGVLLFQADLGAVFLPPFGRPDQQGGVPALPLGQVEVGGTPVEVLVVRLEPDGPLARAVSDEQGRQPGGPEVGEIAQGGHRRNSWNGGSYECIGRGSGPLRAAVSNPLWPLAC